MASRTYYVCTNCGAQSTKWFGRCPECGEWNTLQEETVEKKASVSRKASAHSGIAKTVSLDEVSSDSDVRYTTGIEEFDRVLGGGIVAGSVILLGGEPGAGKSTLLLQLCGHVCQTAKVLYISGEESSSQIKLRAKRLGVDTHDLLIANETDISSVINTIRDCRPDLCIIDSIQTMEVDGIPSSAGSVAQVRESASALTRCAKAEGIPMIIVGHVNKDGAIAGPKVMEHIVDTVLYLEGDRYLALRILRSAKNRYGS
ncbi:MAG: DNA repair protein RadA, partial [Oscillospiraceae bacterium]|nr:DNA repair protein RadA [Oscillospiraceae bacterium]